MSNIILKLEALTTKKLPEKEALTQFKEYFTNFFARYNVSNYKELANITFEELMLSNFLIEFPTKTPYIFNFFQKYNELFSNPELFMEYIYNYHIYPKLHRINNIENKVIRNFQIIKFCQKNDEEPEIINDTLEFINLNPTLYPDIKPILLAKEALTPALNFYDYVQSFQKFLKISLVPDRQAYKGFINNYKEISEFSEYMEKLYFRYMEIMNNFNHKEKEINKKNQKILELIKALKEPKEITNAEELLSLCPEKNLENSLLDYIIQHNKTYYEELVTTLESLKTPTPSNLTYLLAKYNYDYETLKPASKEELQKSSYSDIETILKVLKELNLMIPLKFLPKINLDNLLKVENLIKEGYISLDFLSNHLALIFKDEELINLLLTNITNLKNNGINIKNYHNSLEILLSPIVAQNLALLTSYGLNITKSTNLINFLKEPDLQSIIDLAFELGVIEPSLDVLNYSKNQIYNYKIATLLNIPLEALANEEIFKTSEKLIPSSLKKEFQSSNYHQVSIPEELKPYEENNYFLNIAGILISKRRFLTNLSKFSTYNNLTIFYCLIYDSYYSLEEIMLLENTFLKEKDFLTLIKMGRN